MPRRCHEGAGDGQGTSARQSIQLPTVYPRPVASEAELLAAIYADPAADEPRAVYADFLSDKGHPLGELIALQLARAAGRRGNKTREQALLDQHGHAFWPGHPGVFAGYVPALQFLDRGFPCRAFNVWFSDMRERVAPSIGAPGWATVKTLCLGHDWDPALVRRLLLAVPMPILDTIQELPPAALGALSDDEWARFSRLTEIALSGQYEDIFAAVSAIGPGLRGRIKKLPPHIVGQHGTVSLRLRALPAPKAAKAAKKAIVKVPAKKAREPVTTAPRSATPPASFWEELLASDPASDTHRHLRATADKTLGRLAPDLPVALVERIHAHHLSGPSHVLWPALARMEDVHVEPFLRALAKSERSFEGLLVAAAHRAGGAVGVRAAGAFFAFVDKSSHLPGLYKRLPQLVATEALVEALQAALLDFDTDDAYGTPILHFYGAVFLLERARPRAKVWAALAKKCDRWGDADTLARTRRAAQA